MDSTLIFQLVVGIFGGTAVLMSIPLLRRLQWPAPVSWLIKLYASALSSVWFLTGALCVLAGLATTSILITLTGLYITIVYSIHIYKVTRTPDSGNFNNTFGFAFNKGNGAKNKYSLGSRIALKLPDVPEPRLKQNISFASIPGSERQLLCDIWQPNEKIPPSGMAFIYLHGGAWYLFDKDVGTRPFFKHLTAQGHVIMDVAYRLPPETDMAGMVNDVMRAIRWMKENCAAFGVNPEKITIGGGSSGAHLALLAAYVNNDQFTPPEIVSCDLSVCAVISLYGPADLEAMYYHTNQHLTSNANQSKTKKNVPSKMPAWIIKKMGNDYYRFGMDKEFANAGSFHFLLGCLPDECPDIYKLYSPVTYVHPKSPPTLLIHGNDDILAPVKSTWQLYKRLIEEKVKTVLHILPQTDHAFDLQLPKISHSAHSAIYDVECFLAMQNKIHDEKKAVLTELV